MRLEKLNGTETDTAHFSQNEKCLLYIALLRLRASLLFLPCCTSCRELMYGMAEILWAELIELGSVKELGESDSDPRIDLYRSRARPEHIERIEIDREFRSQRPNPSGP